MPHPTIRHNIDHFGGQCCLLVGLGLFSVWLVSAYGHVVLFILLSIVIYFTLPMLWSISGVADTCSSLTGVHLTSQAVNALDRPTVANWWFHDTVAASLVVGLSPLRVWWNGICFQTVSGTLLSVPTASDRLWKLISLEHKGTSSALEARHDELYKYKTTTTMRWVMLLYCVRVEPAIRWSFSPALEPLHPWTTPRLNLKLKWSGYQCL